MGILKSVGDFLFGKDPDIFDESGRVRHKFTEQKWEQWDDRFEANPSYDWRRHSAVELVEGSKQTPANQPADQTANPAPNQKR